MTTYFISDLHLSAARPDLSALFLKFLATDAKKAEALYILGDFFEMWIGDDHQDLHYLELTQALASFSQSGIPVYIMPGNRDFLIGQKFIKDSGSTLLSDPAVIELYQQRIILTHGDQLCLLDKNYQRFRKFVQHPWIKKLFLKMPLPLRQWMAHFLRARTSARANPVRQKNMNALLKKWDVTTEAVHHLLRVHKAFTLIHGHTHQADIHEFMLDQTPARRIVLGDWHDKKGSVLSFSANEVLLQPIF